MKSIIPAALIVALSGCAAPMTYEQLRAAAATNSNDDLCLVVVSKPQYRKIAEDELASRGATCDWQRVQVMMQARQMQQAQAAQQMQGAMAMINASQPRYVTPPMQSFNCQTRRYGWGDQVSCQ